MHSKQGNLLMLAILLIIETLQRSKCKIQNSELVHGIVVVISLNLSVHRTINKLFPSINKTFKICSRCKESLTDNLQQVYIYRTHYCSLKHFHLTCASSEGQGNTTGQRWLIEVWDGTKMLCNVCLASKWRGKKSTQIQLLQKKSQKLPKPGHEMHSASPWGILHCMPWNLASCTNKMLYSIVVETIFFFWSNFVIEIITKSFFIMSIFSFWLTDKISNILDVAASTEHLAHGHTAYILVFLFCWE